MACAAFEDMLLEYAELPGPDRAKVDTHVLGCAACREYLSTQGRLDAGLIRHYGSINVGVELQQHIRSRVTAQAQLAKPSILPEVLDFIGWAAVVASAFLLFWTMVPVGARLNSLSLVSSLVPFFAAGLALVGAVWASLRAYADLKS
jgi:hypothetical protein